MSPAPKPGDRGYKRSWKNLLINKRYQLRFTLFMVGLSTLLMVGLGFWVMKVADETTEVSMSSVRGTPCPQVPQIGAAVDEHAEVAAIAKVPMNLDGGEQQLPPPPPEPEDTERPRANIQLDASSITMLAPPPPPAPEVPKDLGAKVVAHWTCDLQLAGQLAALEHGRLRILWVMIATGLALVLGLAFYGIKMTHKVAGPLFKVGLYLQKMRDGRLDKVYSLRKGDQLVDFYEHFKHAHAGVVTLQREDIEQLRVLIASAEAAGHSDHAAIRELRGILERKEKSVE